MKNRRPQLVQKLADVIYREYKDKRFSNSRLGAEYEELKTKLRLFLSDAELIQLSLLSAATVVDANPICKITENRLPIRPPTKHPKVSDYRGT